MPTGAPPDPTRVARLLGQATRRARLRLRLTQLEVAARTGISTSVLSRMELGLGHKVPLQTWAMVAAELDVDSIWPSLPGPTWGVEAVIRLATVGGWLAPAADPNPILRRPQRLVRGPFGPRLTPCEVAVVHVVDVLTNIRFTTHDLDAEVVGARAEAPTGCNVRGLLVVLRSEANKRRLAAGSLGSSDPGHSGRWVAALRDPDIAMPGWTGLVWMDARATRLIPVGLNLRGA